MTVLDLHAEAADPDCIDPATAVALLRGAPWRRVAVVGDSVAAGVREPLEGYRNVCFADRLREALAATRSPFAYRNFATRGLRVAEIRERQLGPALGLKPDLALLTAGGNDALSRSFDAGLVSEELVALAAPLADAGALVVTVGLADLARSGLVPEEFASGLAERFDRLDAITASVAERLGGVHVDMHHHPRGTDAAIYGSDRMHANARGHAITFAAIAEALARVAGRGLGAGGRGGAAGEKAWVADDSAPPPAASAKVSERHAFLLVSRIRHDD